MTPSQVDLANMFNHACEVPQGLVGQLPKPSRTRHNGTMQCHLQRHRPSPIVSPQERPRLPRPGTGPKRLADSDRQYLIEADMSANQLGCFTIP